MTKLLLVTSNGTGMGHLTRQAAVALAIGEDHEATLFSLSVGLPLATGLGIEGEYCPSYDRPWIATRNWNSYLRDRLVAIAEETGTEGILFDGVAPYPGIANAARQLRHVAFIWLRRGMWKEANRGALRKGRFFDLVIEPGDLASEADQGPTAGLEATKVGPISILEPLDLIPRRKARSELGLPADAPIALVTLGSGMLGDVAGPGRTAVETLLRNTSDWHIAVTRSPVALNEVPIDDASRLTELKGVYPLATYLAAFDLAVSSAGYNAVHELVPAGIPTLLVANSSTRTDDQIARAAFLESSGMALSAVDHDLDEISTKLRMLVNDDQRTALAERAASTMALMSGATESGRAAADVADGFKIRRRSPLDFAEDQIQAAKETAKAALGQERTESLKRLLGRQPSPVHDRLPVRLSDDMNGAVDSDAVKLEVVRSVTSQVLREDQPIEHVLSTGSESYELRRLEIIRRYYDVVS